MSTEESDKKYYRRLFQFFYKSLNPQKTKRILELQQQLYFKKNVRRRFIAVGHRLFKIKTEKKYKLFHCRTFEIWIQAHGKCYGTRRKVYSLIRIYLIWQKRLKGLFKLRDIHKIGYSKLIMVASELEDTDDPKKIKKIIDDVRHLHYTALRIRRKHYKPSK